MGQEYHISNAELLEIHKIQLELIVEVKRICEKNGIHYNMVGGTMLGAIRHQGYIPWDDDADIGFLREEYEKFRVACKTELDNFKYYFQDFRDTQGYRWGYGKLRRKDTEFLRLNQEDMPYGQGISIDIMPFDNIPDDRITRKIHKLKCFLYRKFFWSAVGRNSEKVLYKRIAYKLMYLYPERKLKESYAKFIEHGRKKRTSQVRILTFPTPKNVDGYKREWYTNLARYSFETMMLPGAKDYDGYLTVKYGKYMELPSREKRKTHPISNLKLLDEKG